MANRFSAFFDTPNQAALELSAAYIVVTIAFTVVWRRVGLGTSSNGLHRTMAVWTALMVLCSAGILLLIGVCLTQSRAGWLALAVGLLAAWWWRGVTLSVVLTSLGILLLLVTGSDGATARATMAFDDAIHGERPLLAGSAAMIAWDYPWWGCGEHFKEILNRWYLPEPLEGRFETCLNDALTLAAKYGLPVLLLSGAMLGSLFSMAVRLRGNPWAAGLIGVLVVHLVAGQFQAHHFTPWHQVTATLVIVSLLAVLFWQRGNLCLYRRPQFSQMLVGAGIGASTTALLFIAVVVLSWSHFDVSTSIRAGVVVAQKRGTEPSSFAIMVWEKKADERFLRRGLLASAMNSGYAGLQSPLEDVAKNVQSVGDSRPILLIGVAESAEKLVRAWVPKPNIHLCAIDPTADAPPPAVLQLIEEELRKIHPGKGEPRAVVAMTAYAPFAMSGDECIDILVSRGQRPTIVVWNRHTLVADKWMMIHNALKMNGTP